MQEIGPLPGEAGAVGALAAPVQPTTLGKRWVSSAGTELGAFLIAASPGQWRLSQMIPCLRAALAVGRREAVHGTFDSVTEWQYPASRSPRCVCLPGWTVAWPRREGRGGLCKNRLMGQGVN